MSAIRQIVSRFINDFDKEGVLEVLRKRRGVIGFYDDGYIVARMADYTFLVERTNLAIDGITLFHPLIYKVIRELHQLDPSIADMKIRTDSPKDWAQTVGWYVRNFRKDKDLAREFQRESYALFHGTSSEAWETIRTKGLRPRSMTRVDPTFGVDQGAKEGDPRFVYFATDEALNAARFAANDAARKHGGFPVILVVVSNDLDMTRAFPDEDSRSETWQGSVRTTGTFAYNGVVLPKKVVPFERFDSETRKWIGWEG